MLLDPRWEKVINDLWHNKARTFLVVLSIAVGVFAFSSVFISGEAMLTNMNTQWRSITPSSISLSIPPFDDDLVRVVRNMENVRDAEGVAGYSAKLLGSNGQQHNASLTAVRDFEEIHVNKITSLEGAFPPGRREILLERASAAFLGVKIGDTITIELADGQRRELVYSGMVHDYTATPPHLYPIISGYASLETLRWLGHPGYYNSLAIATTEGVTDLTAINSIAADIRKQLQRSGYTVYSTSVLDPNKHWGADITMGVVTVLAGIGFISLALSGLLVVNTISSLLAQQQRQIGMMKAVGAQSNQIVGVYLSMTLAFGILALFVALPMGLALGYGFALTIANYLNFDVAIFNIPPWVIVMEIAAALVAPVISALVPILGGTRTTVREALHSYGISHTSKPGLLDRALARIRGIPRPTLLSLRNTFRRKSRLWLTLGTLTFAGATFISVVNTRGSMIAELNIVLDLFQYDVEVYLDNAYPLQQIERKALEVPGVEHAEGWTFARVQRIRPDGEEGPTFSILAPPSGSPFLKPTIQEGRWLEPADENAIVLSSPILRVEPDIHAGDLIVLNVNGIRREVEVVGILSSFGQNYLAYSNFDYLSRTLKASGQTFAVFVGTQNHDMQSQQQVADVLEERFKDQGIGISQISTMAQTIQTNIGQIDFLVYFLMFLALLIAVVGGLGLTGTMSLNVLERTREIGVMRAIGANNGSVRGIVVTEGVVIGVISWVLSIALSIPLTYGLASGVGIAVFQRPAMFTFSPVGVIVWLGLVIVIASAASLVPARRAVQISVREALAYE